MTATATAVAPAPTQRLPLLVGAALAIVYVVWGSTYVAIRMGQGMVTIAEPVTMPTLVGGVFVVLAVAVVVRSELQR